MKKLPFILGLLLALCHFQLSSQNSLVKARVITTHGDTLEGRMENKEYYLSKIWLYSDSVLNIFPRSIIQELKVKDRVYVQGFPIINSLYKKRYSGQVNAYQYKNRILLGQNKNDITLFSLRGALKLHCSDYPDIQNKAKSIKNKDVLTFLAEYDAFKTQNSDSKSFYEQNKHHKPFVNLKLSLLYPGIGVEIGLNEQFTINSFIRNELAGPDRFISFNQLRYYTNLKRREADLKRTYKYSGNYLALSQAFYLNNRNNYLGLSYGWQRVHNKHFYTDFSIGAVKFLDNRSATIIIDLGIGYNF